LAERIDAALATMPLPKSFPVDGIDLDDLLSKNSSGVLNLSARGILMSAQDTVEWQSTHQAKSFDQPSLIINTSSRWWVCRVCKERAFFSPTLAKAHEDRCGIDQPTSGIDQHISVWCGPISGEVSDDDKDSTMEQK